MAFALGRTRATPNGLNRWAVVTCAVEGSKVVKVSADPTRSAVRPGYWAALLTAFFCILFTIAAVLTETHLLRAPWDVVLTITPSLLLAPSFLALLVCVNALTPDERKIWSQLGVAFACVYVPLCVAAYIVELLVVEPRVMRGNTTETALLTIARGDSVFNAIDGIGYIFMCLSSSPISSIGHSSGWQRSGRSRLPARQFFSPFTFAELADCGHSATNRVISDDTVSPKMRMISPHFAIVPKNRESRVKPSSATCRSVASYSIRLTKSAAKDDSRLGCAAENKAEIDSGDIVGTRSTFVSSDEHAVNRPTQRSWH